MNELYPDQNAPGSLDLGDEFPLPNQPWRPTSPSPLAADFPDADTTNWSSDPRPAVTAWEGADMDAYWLDGDTWRHCQTGEEWRPAIIREAERVNLFDAVAAARREGRI